MHHNFFSPEILFGGKHEEKGTESNLKFTGGAHTSLYACAQRTRGLGGRTASQSCVFPGSASSLLESARKRLLYLICPRPSPFLYVFRFLVGASWSQPQQ